MTWLLQQSVLVWSGLLVLSVGCRPTPGERLRLSWEKGRQPSTARSSGAPRPRTASQEPGTAILVGAASDRREYDQRSGVRARILAIDGRKLKTKHPASEVSLTAGCHVIEASFVYKLARFDERERWIYDGPEAKLQTTDYSSGRKYFAIPIRPGRRYELSAQIGTGAMLVQFVEVDPKVGTVARHFPVAPGTRTCVSGTPVGDW